MLLMMGFWSHKPAPPPVDWHARAARLPSMFIPDQEFPSGKKFPIFVTPTPIGTLKLTTGRIVGGCVHPSSFPDKFPEFADDYRILPFERVAPIGEFPVEVSLAELKDDESRIAAARVVFSSQPIVSWEIAIGGDGAKEPGPGGTHGFTGTFGVYMDADAVPMLKKFALAGYDEFSWNRNIANRQEGRLWHHACFQPDESRPENIALFSTGVYEGVFVNYWGLDAAGKPVVLATDCNLIPHVAP